MTKTYLIGRAVARLFLLLILLGLPSVTYSASLALQWDPPATNTDGSLLVDLSHYRLSYGFASNRYTFHLITNKPTASVNGLVAGSNYYFAVAAVNSNGVESDYSNVFFTNVVEGTVPPALQILTSANAITVPEGGTASFQVKLNTTPVSPTTVTVSRVSGDTNLSVQSGSLLVFNSTTWDTYQTVTIRAAEDVDTVNSSAIVRCSAAGVTNKNVTATEQDNDGSSINLALASRGSTITGSNAGKWSKLIDGVTTGYTGSAGYGYTYWTNDVNAPGKMTLDLKGLCTISSMKLLLWDLDSRSYRYKIEASSNNTTWTTIVDRTAATNQCKSWQNISLSPTIQARYLRLTGTYNSANRGFHVVEWQVYGAVGVVGVVSEAMAANSSSSALSSTENVIVPQPLDVRTSDSEPDTNGWKAVDGNTETFWKGQADAQGWWLVLAYGKEVNAQDVQVQWAEGSSTNLLLLGSMDADQWYDLVPLLEEGPVSFEYLWVVLPKGDAGTTPKVSEIRVSPAE